ncbi:MAG: four helix bundle protein [Eubacterium sp.]|nr:four helix bundle protein [Eubacterium sp.]
MNNKDNVVSEKSKLFALRIIKLYKFLCDEQNEYIISKQIMRSGTSIGANISEALRAESKADFYHKLNVSLKEAEETAYWLELLLMGDYIDKKSYESINSDCDELISLLVAITKTQKQA